MAGLVSMTGFGSAAGEAEWGAWTVEAKSVNARGLDIRVNLPPGFEALEPVAKQAAGDRFARGSVQVSVRIDTAVAAQSASINADLLSQLGDIVERREGGLTADGLATLLTVRGVVETGAPDLRALASEDAVIETLRAGFETALDGLAASRAREGEALTGVFRTLVTQLRDACAEATAAAETQPGLLRARLEQQLAEIGAREAVDADRLAAEVALSVAKADVREELDRLAAHLGTAESLIGSGAPAGRKLGFLSQEIGREANTICSKSASLALTNAGLALKALNEQFKEQAANVE